jgi:hypothetical protein
MTRARCVAHLAAATLTRAQRLQVSTAGDQDAMPKKTEVPPALSEATSGDGCFRGRRDGLNDQTSTSALMPLLISSI